MTFSSWLIDNLDIQLTVIIQKYIGSLIPGIIRAYLCIQLSVIIQTIFPI